MVTGDLGPPKEVGPAQDRATSTTATTRTDTAHDISLANRRAGS